MKTTIIAMTIRVKEVSPPNVEETRDLFRDFLEQTMALHSSLAIQGLKTLPKCVGITKLDRLTLYSGVAALEIAPELREQLKSDLSEHIHAFLVKTGLYIDVPVPISIELNHMRDTDSAFVEAGKRRLLLLTVAPKHPPKSLKQPVSMTS